MTHGIAFLRRFADAAFSTNFTENGGIIKNILCFEQTENKQALLKPSGEKAARKQPAMDLSRDKNAEEMKWSPLEMGAAMQAHGA